MTARDTGWILRGALGWMIGEEGRGVRAIIEMVSLTRFDCMTGSCAGQRQVTAQAINHCLGREVFGKALVDQPLMQNVLADLQLEVEGSLALCLRMAEAMVDQLALTMQAHLLEQAGNSAVADGFIHSRLACYGDRNYGTLPVGTDARAIVHRGNPRVQ